MNPFKSKTGILRELLILGSLAFATGSAFADSCSDIRLDDAGGSMEHIEVRNQQQIGSCYAHTAAQMYDAWRFKHGDTQFGRQSSGFEIGQRFKIRESNNQIDDEKNSINGGLVKEVMPLLLEQGSCSQAEMNGLFLNDLTVDQYASKVMGAFAKYQKQYLKLKADARIKSRNGNVTLSLDESLSVAERLRAEVSQLRAEMEYKKKRARSSEKYSSRVVTERTRTVDPRQKDVLRSYTMDQYYRGVVLEEGIKELQALNDSVLRVKDIGIRYEDLKADGDTVDMFNVISIINCPEARRITTREPFKVINENLYNGEHLFGLGTPQYHPERALAILNRELSRGLKDGMPVGMAYCSQMLHEGREYKTPPISSGKCGRHASIVTGRRRNPETQRCQFLIRNSWGKTCAPYSKDWDCDEERGSVWVDADTLARNIFSLQAIRADR